MQKTVAFNVKNLAYLLLVLLAFVLYGNSIPNDYGLDDNFVVADNQYVQKGTAGLKEIFDMPYLKIGDITLDRRPIALVTFALEHQFIGDNPHVSHFINVLLYAICLIVLYIVLVKVFRLDEIHSLLPFVITVFFAVHPLHTEVVDSLKNRDELLVLLFGMLFLLFGYLFYIKERKRWIYAALSLFFLTVTLLSKISGLVFVGIFLLVFFFNGFHKKSKWNYIYILLSFRITYILIVRIFENLNRETNSLENPLTINKDILISVGTSFKILLYHIKMLVVPSPLRFYYGYNMFPLVSITNPVAFLSMILHVLLFIYGAFRFFKKDNLGLFILCYFVAIALYANFPFPYTSMFSERALLLSSLWFITIVAIWGIRLWNNYQSKFSNKSIKSFVAVFFSSLFLVYSFMTINRNFLWKDTLTLISHDIEYLENSVLSNYIYASNLKKASKEAFKRNDNTAATELGNKALYYFQHAIDLYPNHPQFYFKLGSTYRYNLNNLDSAEVNFGYAISIDSLYADAYYELSKLFFDKQEYNKSYHFFGKTYALQPNDSLTLFYYAQSAANVGDMSTCYKINQEFLKLYPNIPYPYLNLGTYYSKILKDDSAVIYLDKAVELGSRNPQLLKQLSVYYQNKNNIPKRDYYNKLLNSK